MLMIRRKTKRAYSFRVRVCVPQKRKISTSSFSLFFLFLSLSLSLCLSRTRAVTRVSFLYRYLKSRGGERGENCLGFSSLLYLGFVFPRAFCFCGRDRALFPYFNFRDTLVKIINDGEEDLLRDGLER